MLYYQLPRNHIDFFRNAIKYQKRTIFPESNLDIPEKSISIVTTCMNRLHDLKVTLPQNLKDNADYGNLEFVLLDYSSTDGLREWLLGNDVLRGHMQSGRLKVYHAPDQKHFRPNHSRNTSFKLAQNELIANVDSDNFTHKDYAKRLNECASVQDNKILIVPDNFLIRGGNRLYLKGRFALYKNDIESLCGFDEDLDNGFGHDDMNFVFRAMLDGYKIVRYESKFTEDRLETSNDDRVKFVRNRNYRKMQEVNTQITYWKLCQGRVSVNPDGWGKAKVFKNYTEEMILD